MPPGGLFIQAVGGGPHPLAPRWIKPQPPGRPVGAGLTRSVIDPANFSLATNPEFGKYGKITVLKRRERLYPLGE